MPVTRDQVLAAARAKGIDTKKYEQAPSSTGTFFGDALNTLEPSGKLTNMIFGGLRSAASGKVESPTGTTDGKGINDYILKAQMKKALNPPPSEESLPEGYTLVNGKPMADRTYINPEKAGREERLREFESRRQAGQLRGELNQKDFVKRFQSMQSAATGIDSMMGDILSRPDNKSKNVGDQALITLYNKILDPMSVVRESEFERTPEGQSALNKIRGFYEKVQSGGSGLTDADRIEVARAAKILINNQGELYNQQLSDYEGLANSYGADPTLVTSGFQRFSPYNLEQQYTGGNQVGGGDPQVESRKQALRQKYAN